MTCKYIGDKIATLKVRCEGRNAEYRPYYKCELHKRCIPKISGIASATWQERPEAKLIKWCHICTDYCEK